MTKNDVKIYTALPSEKEAELINQLKKLKEVGLTESEIAYALTFRNAIILAKVKIDNDELKDILLKDYLFNKTSNDKTITSINTIDNLYNTINGPISILNFELPITSKKENNDMVLTLAENYVRTLDSKFARGNEYTNDVFNFLSTIDAKKKEQNKNVKKLIKAPETFVREVSGK